MEAYKIKRSIKTKIMKRILVSLFLVAAVLGHLSFEFSKACIVAMLGDSTKGVAATIASLISPSDISSILSNSERIKEFVVYKRQASMGPAPGFSSVPMGGRLADLYQNYTKLLGDIKAMNKIDSPINVYVTSGKNLSLAFSSEQGFLIGADYTMRPEARDAFTNGSTQATGIYKDKDGIWISAYAPGGYLPQDSRRVMVEINYKIDSYITRLQEELIIIIIICFAGFLFAAAVSYLMVKDIVASIKKLNEAVTYLDHEDYNKPIDVKSDDEIGHLAATFELMRKSIRKKIDELRLSLTRERKAHLESVAVLTNAIETRDAYTKDHVNRVEKYALLIAKAMRMSHEDTTQLKYGCFLHDIGKIYIDNALLKKGTLSEKDFEEIKKHSERGAKIIEGVQFLQETKDAVLYHQERYDGKGYPKGLKGKDIPLLARIIAVADAFDAMTTDRPYRPKISFEKAFIEIEKNSGTQFDPDVCNAFLQYRDTLEDMAKKHFVDIDD